MRVNFRSLWADLRTSFWFVPTLMVLGAIALAYLLTAVDARVEDPRGVLPSWLIAASPDNARQLLATVGGSMITIAGVSFSVVIVALSLASQQFGPRLLVNFMQDLANQLVLGTFIATFVYCLLVLRSIADTGSGASWRELVPHVSVAGAVGLGLASLGVLIYFFHHVSVSIQAGDVVAKAGRQLAAAVDREFSRAAAGSGGVEGAGREGDGEEAPDEEEEDEERETAPAGEEEELPAVTAETTGYISSVDVAALCHLAAREDRVFELAVREGDFVMEGSVLVRVREGGPAEGELAGKVREAFALSRRRGTVEDVRLAVDRLAEVAVRALSPGTNDPFTAVACIEHLAAGLARLAEGERPPRRHLDADGNLRVLSRPPSVRALINRAFIQVRHYAGGDPVVLLRLAEAITLVAARARGHELRRALGNHAERVGRQAAEQVVQDGERERVERQVRHALELLEAGGGGA